MIAVTLVLTDCRLDFLQMTQGSGYGAASQMMSHMVMGAPMQQITGPQGGLLAAPGQQVCLVKLAKAKTYKLPKLTAVGVHSMLHFLQMRCTDI